MSDEPVIPTRGLDQPPSLYDIKRDDIEELDNEKQYNLNINEGWLLEDRPVAPGLSIGIYYKGEHGDRCIKTEYGWVCSSYCNIVERDAFSHTVKREVDQFIEVYKSIEKIRLFKYKWSIIRKGQTRTFYQGRSSETKDIAKSERLFASVILLRNLELRKI